MQLPLEDQYRIYIEIQYKFKMIQIMTTISIFLIAIGLGIVALCINYKIASHIIGAVSFILISYSLYFFTTTPPAITRAKVLLGRENLSWENFYR